MNAAEAARLIGASRSGLARLGRTWEEHRDETVAGAGTGRDRDAGAGAPTWRQAGMPAAGGGSAGRTLSALVERRRQPAVRVSNDITATTEKPSSVLALLGGADVCAGAPVRLVAVPTHGGHHVARVPTQSSMARSGAPGRRVSWYKRTESWVCWSHDRSLSGRPEWSILSVPVAVAAGSAPGVLSGR